MVDDFSGEVRELVIPFTASPSGGDLFVLQKEERRNAYVLLAGYTPGLDADPPSECVALFTVHGVVQSVFGYPNEEAYWHDPRGEIGQRVVEIVGSKWPNEIDSYNERTFGSAFPWAQPTRHFFFGSKDVSAQFLATDVTLDLFSDHPVAASFEQATRLAVRAPPRASGHVGATSPHATRRKSPDHAFVKASEMAPRSDTEVPPPPAQTL